MKFYYDLALSPPTYDVVSAMCRAEMERQRVGDDRVQVIFLPGPAGGFRRDTLWPHTGQERTRMLRNVAMPIAMLLPDVSVTLAHERPLSGLGVGRRMYGLAEQVRASSYGIRPLRAPTNPARRSNRVTMTLRECEHWPERNSQVDEWQRAGQILEMAGLDVIVIRDTLKADEPLGELTTMPAASRNMFARADLYASAAVNLFVSNGPAWLSLAMDLPTIIFRPGDERLGKAFGRAHFARSGIPWCGQMPGAPGYQRLAWVDDTAEAIVNAVDRFMALDAKPQLQEQSIEAEAITL